MILALEYLHTNNIIYRDIKPESMIVDENGYLIFVSMGTAKLIKSEDGLLSRTSTIIGTPHYMAPEIIMGKGYNFFADFWSIGN